MARCEPLLVRADQFSCRQLDSLENTVEAYTSSLGKRAWELSDMVARERREHGTVGASAIVVRTAGCTRPRAAVTSRCCCVIGRPIANARER